jgi:membrane dipeptidase
MSGWSRRAERLFLAILLTGAVTAGTVTGQNPAPAASAAQRPAARAESLQARALRIHREAVVFDTHIDSIRSIVRPGWKFTDRHIATDGHVDLPRMKEGGLTAAFFAIDGNDQIKSPLIVEDSLRQLDVLRSVAEEMPDKVMLCLTASDVRRAKAAGKVAMLIAVEGGHMINDSLAMLRAYARLGARSMTLTHFVSTSWADAAGQAPEHNGLTEFGKEVVREMNRLGLLIDISHVSDKTFYDTLETSQAPIFASHSAARALSSHARNMTDDMIKALASRGGVIQINFHAGYLDDAYFQATQKMQLEIAALRKELEAQYPGQENVRRRADEVRAFQTARLPKIPWTRIVDHIDHAVKLVGTDHVGIGSDFDGAPMPDGMEDSSLLPRITEELLRRGYREADIKKILGGNTLRVLEGVEAVSRKLRTQATS